MSQEPTPTDPREEKKSKVFLVTMRARKNDGASETVSFRSGIFACESEAHAKVAMLEGREPEFSIDELDAKPFDTNFLTEPLESTISKLAAEIAELKADKFALFDSREKLNQENATLRAELEAARKERDAAVEWKSNAERILADGHAVHLNMLRGTIATPTKAQLLHVIGDQSLYTAEKDRDTALAAKDAAEKRVAELVTLIESAPHSMDCPKMRPFRTCDAPVSCNCWKHTAFLLTPAPTQEPPAGVSPWQPIETAPTDGKIQIMIAEFRDGELIDIDFDAVLEQESESWEMPQTYWIWKSAHGRVENPTHWQPIIPPAGGVTISNETVGIIPTATTLTEASPDVSTLGAEAASHPISTEKKGGDEPCHKTNALAEDAQCSPEVTHTTALVASNSPADVPSEGRGECVHGIKMTQVCEKCSRFLHFHNRGRGELLPFNLSDALAGKPVVTRNGEPVTGFKETEHAIYPVFGHIGNSYAFWTKKGEHYHGIETDWDLFMLPTEGSGA